MEIDLFGNIITRPIEYNTEEQKVNPFIFLKSISNKQKPNDLNGFNKYLTNLAMSQRSDTILYANEVNRDINISDQMVFDFYFYGLPKKNYWSMWAKNVVSEYNECVKEYFKVSSKVASQYEKLIKEKDKKLILEWFQKREGGKQ